MDTPTSLTFTLDLENPHPSDPLAHVLPTRAILELLSHVDVRATVFCVGDVAGRDPGLIRDIARAGHEIAFHSMDHRTLLEHDRESFRTDVTTGKQRLEDMIGESIVGYRAPVFSLVEQTSWATDILSEVGFRYSSSVLPAGNPLYGYPGAPRSVFTWSSGLLEIPAALIPRLHVPFFGGIYFRYLPTTVLRRIAPLIQHQSPWFYCHPYDVDTGESFTMNDVAPWANWLLMRNRGRTLNRIEDLLTCRWISWALPFKEQLPSLGETTHAMFPTHGKSQTV